MHLASPNLASPNLASPPASEPVEMLTPISKHVAIGVANGGVLEPTLQGRRSGASGTTEVSHAISPPAPEPVEMLTPPIGVDNGVLEPSAGLSHAMERVTVLSPFSAKMQDRLEGNVGLQLSLKFVLLLHVILLVHVVP